MDEQDSKMQTNIVIDECQSPDSLREDLNAAMRFLHFMGMQTKLDVVDTSSRLFALIEELVANGQLDLHRFDERLLRLRVKEEARAQDYAHVQVADNIDKYKIEDIPQIDCQSRISLCKARCCKLVFHLSFQDLDEHIIQWDYSAPYQIRRKSNGFCIHHHNSSGRCLVYVNRPAMCRTYDCRYDKRIWIDFEQRILSPEEENQHVQSGTDQSKDL